MSEFGKSGPGPDLRKYQEKLLSIKLNANRHIVGILRGYDGFMNLVIDNAVQVLGAQQQRELGMVVVRGNSIVRWECLDKINTGSGL